MSRPSLAPMQIWGAVAAGILIFQGCRQNPWEESAGSVLKAYFKSPTAKQAVNLKGDSTSWMGTSAFLRFETAVNVIPKNSGQYVESAPSEAVNGKLIQKFPEDDEKLHDLKNLKYFFKPDPRPMPGQGEHLVRHVPSGTYFFWSDHAH